MHFYRHFRLLTGRLRLPLLAAAALLLASFATRAALALRPEVTGLGWFDYLQAFARGFWFDAATALLAATPLVLILMLTPDALARTRVFRALALAAFAASLFLLLLTAVGEWLFWNEFGARFNFIAVDYLLYTHEVIGNIRESYPVGRILGAIALASALATALVARPLWRSLGVPAGWRQRGAVITLQLFAAALVLAFTDSDQKRFSASDVASELAGNGFFDFFAANRRNELSYERYYTTLPLEDALGLVRAAFPGSDWVADRAAGVERRIPAAQPERRLNVVLISVESLGSEFLGAYGDARGLTPNLDRLARESLWFSDVYATGNRTVRGMEALSLALPPTPGLSIVRRPNNELLFSLGSVFEDKGYGVLFAYGGYGYFDNMNAFFDANDYRVIDRRVIPSERIEFENVWGVADEHLYDQVLEEIDREKAAKPERPVFVHVMTTSNHRPYTYPANRIDIPSGSGREGAVKYTDFAIGHFLEGARAKPWFRDTLFVITADHGASARGTSQIPLDKYRIPLFVYSPAHVAAQHVGRLMSQIDIPPTLLGLLNVPYYSKFLGRDLLHSPPELDRAFVANYQTLGYLKGDRMVTLLPKRGVEAYRLAKDGSLSATSVDPTLRDEAIAFYEVASHLFRSGLYRDEEQLAPAARNAPARVAAGIPAID